MDHRTCIHCDRPVYEPLVRASRGETDNRLRHRDSDDIECYPKHRYPVAETEHARHAKEREDTKARADERLNRVMHGLTFGGFGATGGALTSAMLFSSFDPPAWPIALGAIIGALYGATSPG
ncbi:hypothetical protein ER308_15075 [Egibacter rhizosphaerae]|uniref:Uncharacterized protein n=1 Tax=Egibacter rhizosphaerae TaxID=1670831 RepID=A0A411YHR0_9ACTN|nr:hypothetical protein [Egibacter rhizosphaerae]QBI20753.1 hypothetical protein ER308_15075 [Egibacter rhizosphaerae]